MKTKISKIVFVLIFMCLPSISLAAFDVSLKYGSRGDAVIELQDFLQNKSVYNGKLDGRFGLGTLKAVKIFQATNGLQVDGYWGKVSRAKASELLAQLLKASNVAEQNETGTISAPVIPSVKADPAPIIVYSYLPQPATTLPEVNVVPVVPREVDFYSLLDGKSINSFINTKSATFSYVHLNKGDKITFIFLGNGTTKTIELDNGNAQFTFPNLNPAQDYTYVVKIERGNEYAIINGKFTTLNE